MTDPADLMTANVNATSLHEKTSNRGFGLVMAAFLAVLALSPLLNGKAPHAWLLCGAASFLVTALVRPRSLAPLNRAWTKVGLVMSSIIGPIALAVLFFGVITPYGWLMRRIGTCHIPTRFDEGTTSYWISRDSLCGPQSTLRQPF